jgi:hypothetical protein
MSLDILYPELKNYSHAVLFPVNNTQPINGLGNILFRIASQYGICNKYNLKINVYSLEKFIDFGETIKMFVNWKKTILRNIDFKLQENVHDITLHEIKKAHIYDEQLISDIIKNKDKNILIKDSYLQSHKYFNGYEDDIQNIFAPDEISLEFINNKYPELKDKSVINISLHLRLEWGGNYSYKIKYFEDSIHFFENKYNNSNTTINYFVFSDNINKAKDILASLNKSFIYCENNFDYIDLWIMSLCNHNIICHSTIGWWGAYLNKNKNKCVLYPSDMITFYSMITEGTNIDLLKENHLPNNWISINSNSIYR